MTVFQQQFNYICDICNQFLLSFKRYITLPGQAVSYKIGEFKILEIRKNREEELGENFDLRAFHRHILTCIGPIEMLEDCVKEEEKLPFERNSRQSKFLDEKFQDSTNSSMNSSYTIQTSTVIFLLSIFNTILWLL